MEKYIYIFVIIFVVIVIPVALYIIFKPMFRHNKLLNGIVNYDTFMRKFVFCISLTKEDFYAQLKIHNINDVLEYSLNEDCSVITFTRYNAKFPYKILIDEFDEVTILRVEQIQKIMDKGNVPYYINEFFIKKFNATPLEFEKYSF
ncbi:MAG: hypothetical protein E7539_06865 [Ruminococcaceae bacterium]|nr:hypothetical protein [Oscillospiraceae bacterium]